MINLMPPDAKMMVIYARRNSRLFHWTLGSIAIIIAMAATVVLGGFYIDSAKNNLATSIDQTTQTISDQKLDKIQTQAENLSNGVKLVVQVLSKEVLFSKLLNQIGTLMPTGATLGSVQLSNKINGALDLTANAIDYQSATQVQVNLQDPKNKLFDKVDTLSVTCIDATQTTTSTLVDSRYKCQIQVRAQFSKDASVTFLASKPTKTGANQ